MIEPRKGEQPTSNCIRTARYFETDEGWFVQTREGIHVGPYRTSFDAELASSLLISRLAQLDKDEAPAQTIHSFLRDPAYGPCQVQNPIRVTTRAELIRMKANRRIGTGRAVLGKLVGGWRALSSMADLRR